MRITILLPDARVGGAQNVLLRLSGEFMLNHPITILCLSSAGSLQKAIPDDGARLQFLSLREQLRIPDVFKVFFALVGHMRAQADITILSTGTGTNILACAARIFAPKGLRLVIREACSSKNSDGSALAWLKSFFYPLADGMVGVSDGVARELTELTNGQRPVVSIPNPIDLARLQELAGSPDATLENFPHRYLLAVGRLVPQKNTELLIKAFAQISSEVSEHLVIIGGGPLEFDLRQQIAVLGLESRVHLLGEIGNPHPWYRLASAFVLSSDWEGYPNVLIEALAHGLKVVATDCEFGPRQILAGGKYGALVPMRDVKAMADAIRNTLRTSGIDTSWNAEQFSPKVVADQYEAFMQSLSP